jgi:hypothetical protein
MYFCDKRSDFASFYKFAIEFWNGSDSVVFFVFHFCTSLNKGNNKITEHRAIFQREKQNS